MSRFQKATREKAKARVALEGPAGSGKTWSALSIATSLGDRIAVLDTEAGSASKYAGGKPFDFDVDPLESYDPNLLIEAITEAAAEGYDVIVIDSLSHFWMGEDGMLEQVDRAAKRSGGGNSFAGWKDVGPTERRMISAMIKAPLHVIVTMRTRTEWVIEENDRGKKVPRKIGLKPVQREGIEFEFDVVGDLDIENNLTITKSRCPELSGQIIRKPDGNSFGGPLKDWLETGHDPVEAFLQIALDPRSTVEQLRQAYSDASRRQLAGRMVPDEAGNDLTLGELLIQRGKSAAADAETAAFDAQVDATNGNGEAATAAPEPEPEPSTNSDTPQTDGAEAATSPEGDAGEPTASATSNDGEAAASPDADASADQEPQGSGGENASPSTSANGTAADESPAEPAKMTEKTRRRLFALFTKNGIKDKEVQLKGISEVIGRNLESRGDLTEEEALRCVEILAARENQPEPEAVSA